jgi:hypothetical protein
MRLAVALALLLATPAYAWNEPNDIQGVPWGATQATLQAKLQETHDPVQCDSAEFCNTGKVNFGPVRVSIAYFFPKDGQFEMAVISFNPSDYNRLLTVFLKRYGQPASTREERMQVPKTCSTTSNRLAQWAGDRVLIDLRQYASPTEGRATIMLKTLHDRDAAESRAEKEKG